MYLSCHSNTGVVTVMLSVTAAPKRWYTRIVIVGSSCVGASAPRHRDELQHSPSAITTVSATTEHPATLLKTTYAPSPAAVPSTPHLALPQRFQAARVEDVA